jgi:tetratricopeptide (TPR) repeat protein
VLLDLLCLCELNLDNLSSAEQALDRALELAPWHPHLLAHRAFLLAKQGRFDEAEDTIEDALATDPEDAMVLRARALVAAMNGDRRSAEEYSANLLALDPQDQMAHLVRGNVAAERAQFGRALRHYTEALRHDPSDEELAEIVRVNRVAAHPILVPLRPLIRFGRYRSWAAYLVVYWTLRAAGQDAIALTLGGVWLVIVAISWLAPPILTRYYARRSPGL